MRFVHLLAVAAAFCLAAPCFAQGSLALQWIPPTTNTDGTPLANLAGYKVYAGTVPGSYSNSTTLTNASLTGYVLNNLAPATWYATVTALSSTGAESVFSNVVNKTIVGPAPPPDPVPVPPPAPAALTLSSTRIDAADWTCRDAAGAIVTSNQRQDTAYTACANLAIRNPGKVYELRPSGYRIVAR